MLFDPYSYEITPWLRFVQRLLLALIVVGLVLLVTQMFWVPRLVDYLLERELVEKVSLMVTLLA